MRLGHRGTWFQTHHRGETKSLFVTLFEQENSPACIQNPIFQQNAGSGWLPRLRRGTMSYLDDSLAHLEVFEGTVPWMYLDTRGFVTVGVGELLANAAKAETLAFVNPDGQPSTQ